MVATMTALKAGRVPANRAIGGYDGGQPIPRGWRALCRFLGTVLLALAIVALSSPPSWAMDLDIARDGASSYRIVVGRLAPESTLYAASELQEHLARMTGAILPIVTDSTAATPYEILLGPSTRRDLAGIAPAPDSLGDEGYAITTVGERLVITGGEPRGVLYGVYGLLENHLGCRWFTPEVDRIPRLATLILPALADTVLPVFSYRELYLSEAFNPDWAARNRLNRNSVNGGLDERHGGRIEWMPGMFAHTFAKLVPPDKYFAAHPEYFSLVGGKRVKEQSQLCCTNDAVVALVTAEVLRLFRENPVARVISISQNDWDNHCTCPVCRALEEREGSAMAPVLSLVNRVAEAVEVEMPGRCVETLAYQWTRKPPRTMRPRGNVVIRLCTIECCFSHPLDGCESPQNKAFVEDLRAWGSVAPRLWVWTYATSFPHYFLPFPGLRVYDDNLRLFAENNVAGVFHQDIYTTLHGEFSDLSGYLAAKLLWNPKADTDSLMTEFLDGVYGPAAPPIRAWLDLLHDIVERERIHVSIWQGPDAAYLDKRVLGAADSLWDDAERRVAGDAKLLERVRIERLSADYALLAHARLRGDAWIVHQETRTLTVNPAFTARLDRFCRVAEAAGVARLAEYGTTVAEFRAQTDSLMRPRKLTLHAAAADTTGLSMGLTVRCYTGSWRTRPTISSLKPARTLTVAGFDLPPDSTGASSRVYQFQGWVRAPRDGVYAFVTRSDGYASLAVAGETVVEAGGSDPVRERRGFVALKAGLHTVRAEVFTRVSDARFEVSVTGPDGVQRRVDGGMLKRR